MSMSDFDFSSNAGEYKNFRQINRDRKDPSLWKTRGTHLTVTRGTHHHPNHHHPDSPKDMHEAVLLSGSPQGKAKDVSTSHIQGRANVAGKAQTSGQPS
ncbi:hypothetical protein CK203_022844 [Vitis vinifera]|uniref:Uncharacterized protein n=1 Tax=Vitis vinifera TaxID=29760 RepID=A0A438IW65_VITVI|nr:hypothetical protein CK203_069796 [Vitis vinifera]RVX00980.1 hypothetical protein CK203_022844 [Vitis vinifera]